MKEHVHVHANVRTDFVPEPTVPRVDATAYVHPQAAVIGAVQLGPRVFVAPMASVRGDEGTPIHIGPESNVQDGVVVHGLETWHDGAPDEAHLVEVQGRRYAVYVGARVSLAHQCQIHGPALVEADTFVGMQALVFRARIGGGCVIEPAAKVMGVTVAPGRYVPAGTILKLQGDADALPTIDEHYPLRTLNATVVHVNVALALGYAAR